MTRQLNDRCHMSQVTMYFARFAAHRIWIVCSGGGGGEGALVHLEHHQRHCAVSLCNILHDFLFSTGLTH